MFKPRCALRMILFGLAMGSSVICSAMRQDPETYVLHLGGVSFDPLMGFPTFEGPWDGRSADRDDLFLVQLTGPTQDKWMQALARLNWTPVQYISPYTYVVWGHPAFMTETLDLDFVRFVGPFLPAFRVRPSWRELDDATREVRIMLCRHADLETTIHDLSAVGLTVRAQAPISSTWVVVTGTLPGDRMGDAASIPGVYSLALAPEGGGERGEMSNQICARQVNATGLPLTGYLPWLASRSLSGQGVIMAVVDSGTDHDHVNLAGRMLPCSGTTCGGSASGNHGTHTAGIMAADNTSGVQDSYGFFRGLGVAPGANLVEQIYSSYPDPNGLRHLIEESHTNGAVLSSNSWGPSSFPVGYDDDTLQVDLGVRDADASTPGNQPFIYVLSIMNGGGGISSQGTPDEAKNIIAVGSTDMQNSSGAPQTNHFDISANSAHGPALDGRHLPHIVAPGCYVDSTYPNSTHGLKCGTSMASPHVSGSIALLLESFRASYPTADDPSPAWVKALLLVTATDLAGHLDADDQVLGHPFDDKQGWGRLDLDALLDAEPQRAWWDQHVILDDSGDFFETAVRPLDPNQPVKLMLVWTDAPGHGLGGATPAWNNDLDLTLTRGEHLFRGNGFGPDGYSQPDTAADTMNNTEGIFLPAPGNQDPMTLRVTGTNINSDGVPGVGDSTDQDFALVCLNAQAPRFALGLAQERQDVCASGVVEFLVIADLQGATPQPITLAVEDLPPELQVQWSENPITPPGSTTLTISGTDQVNPDTYPFRIIADDGDWELSAYPELTVLPGNPVVAQHPQNVDACPGDTVSLNVILADDNGVSYRWQKDGTLLPGETQPILTLDPVSLSDVGVYAVEVENVCGQVTSESARLIIRSVPGILAFWPAPVNVTDLVGIANDPCP